MNRYLAHFGERARPSEAVFYASGPQNEEHVPEPVRRLLDMPGVTQVDVRFATSVGDRIQVFQKMPSTAVDDAVRLSEEAIDKL